MIAGFEDENILVLRFFMVENLIDLEGHCLTRPHVGNLTEPAICVYMSVIFGLVVVNLLR